MATKKGCWMLGMWDEEEERGRREETKWETVGKKGHATS